MYEQKNQISQWVNPAFGVSEYASFGILFCHLGSAAAAPSVLKNKGAVLGKLNAELNPDLWNRFLPSNRMAMARGVIEFLKAQSRLAEQQGTMSFSQAAFLWLGIHL
jgi:hypothetical protein